MTLAAPQFSEVEVEGRGAVIEVRPPCWQVSHFARCDGDDVALFGFGNNPLVLPSSCWGT